MIDFSPLLSIMTDSFEKMNFPKENLRGQGEALVIFSSLKRPRPSQFLSIPLV